MAKKRRAIPKYGTVTIGDNEYYRTRIEDADGVRVAIMEELVKNFMIRSMRQGIRLIMIPSEGKLLR